LDSLLEVGEDVPRSALLRARKWSWRTEAKDFIQRQRSKWKELVGHEDRINIVLDKMLEHFLNYPDPNGFKAQSVAL
jgi:hypothetical protein